MGYNVDSRRPFQPGTERARIWEARARLEDTQATPAVSDSDLLAEYPRGAVPRPLRSWGPSTEAVTQELPAVPDPVPAREWPVESLDRLLADLGVQS